MLALDRVSKVYKVGAFGGTDLPAVREVSFDVRPGEVVALIGESGSGKSTIGRMILRLAAVTTGSITFDGTDVSTLRGRQLKAYYRQVQGVFQDPFSSYNPIFKADHVFDMIREEYFPELSSTEWQGRLNASLERVGLDPDQVLHKFPHQLSGGQLQRLLIARAFLLDIRFLVADEIISMLDASTRIDVLNLLGDCAARGLGVLFITHDLSLGNYVSERCIILRHGRIVEMGATERVFGNPLHPYTRNLLACVPHLHEKWGGSQAGAPPAGLPGACVFHALRPPGSGIAPGATGGATLAEADEQHFVACAAIDGDDVCDAAASGAGAAA